MAEAPAEVPRKTEMKYIPEKQEIEVSRAEFDKLHELNEKCRLWSWFNEGQWVAGCAEMGMPVDEMIKHAPVKITVV